VTEDRAEVFLETIINHFLSRKLPFVCFRVSPLTRPSFISLLERYGFERELEESIMAFEGRPKKIELQPNVTVNEIREDSLDVFNRLMATNFEMPAEWKEAMDRLFVDFVRKGTRNYLAYVDGQPVGTTSLFSQNKTGCILNVSTLKEFRNRGIGAQLTMHSKKGTTFTHYKLTKEETQRGSTEKSGSTLTTRSLILSKSSEVFLPVCLARFYRSF
jgi:ribosomal protein S18 acetylase RimI-like enzyme